MRLITCAISHAPQHMHHYHSTYATCIADFPQLQANTSLSFSRAPPPHPTPLTHTRARPHSLCKQTRDAWRWQYRDSKDGLIYKISQASFVILFFLSRIVVATGMPLQAFRAAPDDSARALHLTEHRHTHAHTLTCTRAHTHTHKCYAHAGASMTCDAVM